MRLNEEELRFLLTLSGGISLTSETTKVDNAILRNFCFFCCRGVQTRLSSAESEKIWSGRHCERVANHMRRHVFQFSSIQRDAYMAAVALGATFFDARDEILIPRERLLSEFFRSGKAST